MPSPNRPSPRERGYGPRYRHARKQLLASNPDCHWCGQPATTADHYPPLAHLRAQGRDPEEAELLPACARCNYSHEADRRIRGQQPPSRNW